VINTDQKMEVRETDWVDSEAKPPMKLSWEDLSYTVEITNK
jgi:hypothetical protein